MHAQVPYWQLRKAVHALRPYTGAQPATRHSWLVNITAHADVLTVGVTTGTEHARVGLAGVADDGQCALPLTALTGALTAIEPSGSGYCKSLATLLADGIQLQVSVNGGGSVSLPTGLGTPFSLAVASNTHQLIGPTPAKTICAALTDVGRAADTTGDRPDLAVVRFTRDAGASLLIEAADPYRVHRSIRSEPCTTAADVRMPIAAARRAIALVKTCDPNGNLTIDADAHHIRWQTDTVQLLSLTSAEPYPDHERIREQTVNNAHAVLNLDRNVTYAELKSIAALAKMATESVVVIDASTADDTATVALSTSTGELTYRTTVPARHTAVRHSIRLRPQHTLDAFTFLDGDTVTVTTTSDWQPAYLESGARHAILAQVRPM